MTQAPSSFVMVPREVMEFYADPFAWKKKNDPQNLVQIPDFYSELSFGGAATEALAARPAKERLTVAESSLLECAEILEKAEEAHANCDECEGEGVPELCEKCFPLFDEARIKRRLAIAAARSQP